MKKYIGAAFLICIFVFIAGLSFYDYPILSTPNGDEYVLVIDNADTEDEWEVKRIDIADLLTGTSYDKIEEGDSSVEVTDTGTGRVDITVDGTQVATATADGLSLGPLATILALSDEEYSGKIYYGYTAGEDIDAGEWVYFDGSAGQWMLADRDATGKWPAWGIAPQTVTSGNVLNPLYEGTIRLDSSFEFTIGDRIGVDTTAGASTAQADGDCTASETPYYPCTGSGTGTCDEEAVAIAYHADMIYVNCPPVLFSSYTSPAASGDTCTSYIDYLTAADPASYASIGDYDAGSYRGFIYDNGVAMDPICRIDAVLSLETGSVTAYDFYMEIWLIDNGTNDMDSMVSNGRSNKVDGLDTWDDTEVTFTFSGYPEIDMSGTNKYAIVIKRVADGAAASSTPVYNGSNTAQWMYDDEADTMAGQEGIVRWETDGSYYSMDAEDDLIVEIYTMQ